MKKNIELTLKEAQELYGQNHVMDKMLLANFSKEELENTLPTKWEDLKKIEGRWINSCGNIAIINLSDRDAGDKNVFASEKEAKSALAMAQLSQLMKVYRNGWEPDWKDNSWKYVIERYQDKINKDTNTSLYTYLSFPESELRDKFLENFRDLIEDYFMIEKN